MQISKPDADLFFELMWSLQFYVNQRLNLIPNIPSPEAYRKLPSTQKLIARKALYDNIGLLDDFVKINPHHLSDDNLAIVDHWRFFVADKFFIERLLKKYAVFIQDQNVYAVLALYDPFEVILANISLPCYVKAVLLPFKGRIIYDGLLESYRVHFGGGISSNVKEIYMAAKQNGKIIESLDQQKPVAKPKRQASKDWRPEVDDILSKTEKLRSSSNEPAILGQAFGLSRASLELTQAAVRQPDNIDELWQMLKKVQRAVKKIETTLERAE